MLVSFRFALLVVLAFAAFDALPRASSANPGFPDQLIDQPLRDGSISGGSPLGQSFTVTVFGEITSISMHSTAAWTSTLRIYEGAGNAGTQIYSQSITSTAAYDTHVLTTPVPVTPGVYTFQTDVTGVSYEQRSGDVYPDGIAYSGNMTVANTDLKFQVQIIGGPATEVIEQLSTDGGISGGSPIGQSFTAGITGEITEISFHSTAIWASTLRVYDGAGNAGTELHSQPIASTGVFNTHVLTVPVPVTAGSTYTFLTDVTSVNYLQQSGDVYPDGIAYSGNSPVANTDLVFRVVIEQTSADTTPPVLDCPVEVREECTDPTGQVVNFTVTADDDCDGAVTPVCTPPSGSMFPPGTTTVTCTATDMAGNQSQCMFDVIVEDTTAPMLDPCPADITVECVAGGNVVNYTAPTASDVCDPSPTVSCSPPSGSTFMPGTTPVTCTATDASGNQSSCMFNVIVEDTTPPILTCALLRTTCWPPTLGLLPVGFTATVMDACDPNPTLTIEVFSNEANGAAPYSPDAVLGATPESLALRSERQVPGAGRIYVVRVTASDGSGNTTVGCKSAVVPSVPTLMQLLQVRALALQAEADCLANPAAAPADVPAQILP